MDINLTTFWPWALWQSCAIIRAFFFVIDRFFSFEPSIIRRILLFPGRLQFSTYPQKSRRYVPPADQDVWHRWALKCPQQWSCLWQSYRTWGTVQDWTDSWVRGRSYQKYISCTSRWTRTRWRIRPDLHPLPRSIDRLLVCCKGSSVMWGLWWCPSCRICYDYYDNENGYARAN